MSFQFHAVEARLDDLNFDKLRVKTGEAVAVCSIFNLHRLLAADGAKGSPYNAYPMLGTFGDLLRSEHGHNLIGLSPDWAHSSPSPIESFLSSLYALSPKVVVVAEQEANHNGELCERFAEAIYYYANLFDCMQSTAPRAVTERARVEKVLLGEEIKNIIACDGLARRERHEKLERWEQRLNFAGFGRVPLSYGGLEVARGLLESRGCEGHSVKDKNGCFFLCWKERPLFSVSAWRFKRF
ncbi:scarecrow-like protein 3 [Typha angustifolia]|uniref:scarecrow-like protein 3 n=1 Tax=Typha angustifolia TaxID=59011 RepID=UPI003C2AE4B9